MSKRTDLKVFKSATGLGLKALRKFAPEEEIVEYTGPRVGDEDIMGVSNRYLFQLTDTVYIDGSGRSNLARYINHSCSPNAQAWVSEDETKITIEAIKPIKKGDEIVINYGTEYFDEFIAPIGCQCVKCRAESD